MARPSSIPNSGERSTGSAPLVIAVILALATPWFVAPQAHAETAPNAQQLQLYEAATEEERVRLLIAFAKSGKHELAEDLMRRYPLRGPHAKNRTLFLRGLILSAQGDLTGAAEKFRAALAADPKLTLVRAELAQTLVILEQDESAIHHLKLLEADAPDAQQAAGVRAFIDRVDERSPLKFNAYLSLAPTTNANNGSKHTKIYLPGLEDVDIEIDPSSREQSGIGLAGGFNVGFSKRLGNDFSFVAGASADARLYEDGDFNSFALSQSAEIRYIFERGYFGLGAVASQSLESDISGINYYAYGPRVSGSLALSPRNALNASAVHEWREYIDSPTSDGTAILVDAAFTHAFDSSFRVTVSGGYDRVISGLDWNSYRTWSAGLSLYKELPMGITARLNGEARFSDFDGINLFMGVKREDERYSGGLTLTKRDWNIYGFAPSLSYDYTTNSSNIALYDYDSHAVDFRLTKEF
jgi:tetratricopeptide (TPR) repeat protein